MSANQDLIDEIARLNREAIKEQNKSLKSLENARRMSQKWAADASEYQNLRSVLVDNKEFKRQYAEFRTEIVKVQNQILETEKVLLENILVTVFELSPPYSFENLPLLFAQPLARPQPPVLPELTGMRSILPNERKKHEEQVNAIKRKYAEKVSQYKTKELNRRKKLERLLAFKQNYMDGIPSAIVDYCLMMLMSSCYPDNFPLHIKVAYVPESKQLVIEYDLPKLEDMPKTKAFKYVKSRDEITTTDLPATQRKSLYSSVIAQIALRTLYEVFQADTPRHIDTVVFNGYVDSIDPATGQAIRPCLVTVRTTRDVFQSLDLARVDPTACLRGLNASVSKKPEELAPVRPVVEFNMVDARFVEETDVLSVLDQRQNLMELSPFEFENLIGNLFQKMGLETRQTQSSRDGGVDCVAYDPRPIFGGKVVIQAKRYKNTVGVSAVRDLFGTLQNEGASKGILVTTSGYGKAAFEFAEGKPIELLDGSNLLYLLAEHAGIEAKIEIPEDWQEPRQD